MAVNNVISIGSNQVNTLQIQNPGSDYSQLQ